MTTTNTFNRQPTKLDYASPTQFKFNIIKLPKVTYFCTQVNVPGLSLGGTIDQQTRFKDIPQPGDKLTYGDFIAKHYNVEHINLAENVFSNYGIYRK